jgi:hypothetical protein
MADYEKLSPEDHAWLLDQVQNNWDNLDDAMKDRAEELLSGHRTALEAEERAAALPMSQGGGAVGGGLSPRQRKAGGPALAGAVHKGGELVLAAPKLGAMAIEKVGEITATPAMQEHGQRGIDRVNNLHNEWTQLFEAEQNAYPGASNAFDMGGLVGEAAWTTPLMATKALSAANTMKGLYAKNIGVGAGTMALITADEADDLNELTGAMTLGGLMGAGAATLHLRGGLEKNLATRYANSLEKAAPQEALALEQSMKDDLLRMADDAEAAGNDGLAAQLRQDSEDFGFTMAQIATDDPWLIGAEGGAAKQYTMQRQKRQMEIMVRYLDQMSGTKTPSQILDEASGIMIAAGKQQRKIAQQNYARSTNQLFDSADGTLVMDYDGVQRYWRSIDATRRELMNPLTGPGKIPKQYERFFDEVDVLANPYDLSVVKDKAGRTVYQVFERPIPGSENAGTVTREFTSAKEAQAFKEMQNRAHGGLTAEESMQIARKHNDIMNADKSPFDSASGIDRHFRYMNTEFLYGLSTSDDAIASNLRRVQLHYAADMQKARVLKNNVLGKVLGKSPEQMEAALATPKALLDTIMDQGDWASNVKLRTLLEEIAPEVLDDLKRAYISRAVQSGYTGGVPASQHPAKPAAIEKGLQGDRLSLPTSTQTTARARPIPGERPPRPDPAAPPATNIQAATEFTDRTGTIGAGLFSPAEQTQIRHAARSLRQLETTYSTNIRVDTQGILADVGINTISRSPEFMARLLVRLGSRGTNVERLLVDPIQRKNVITLANKPISSVESRLALASLAAYVGQLQAERIQQRQAEAQAQQVAPEMRE